MKAEFDFDGERLRLYLKVEDRCEVAMAKLLERYNIATVSLVMPRQEYGYSHYRDEDPQGVEVIMREGPKCPATGKACEKFCDKRGNFNDGGTGCDLVPQCQPQQQSNTTKEQS